MAITPVNYTRKGPDIEIVQFVGAPEELEEIRDWVVAQIPSDSVVTFQSDRGGWLAWRTPAGESVGIGGGNYLGRDSNGKMFKVPQEMLVALFDKTV